MGKPGSKTGSPSSDSSINSTPSSCFEMGLSLPLSLSLSLSFNCRGRQSSAFSIDSTPSVSSSSSTWFLNIVIKVNILAALGDGWELWKPCLLSKLWTRKPENTKQGSESLSTLHMYCICYMMRPQLNCTFTLTLTLTSTLTGLRTPCKALSLPPL